MFRISWEEFQIMINPPPPPKPPTPHKEMLISTFALPNGYKPVIDSKEPAVTTLVKTEDTPEEDKSPDKKYCKTK